MSERDNSLLCLDCGRLSYESGLALQERLMELRQSEAIPDTALFLEHEPVITLGRRGLDEEILASPAALQAEGIAVHRSNRGGQVTYHGPGQLVVYLIFHLYEAHRQLRQFVETLEGATIDYLRQDFGIESRIDPEHPGVWVGNAKIAALGIAVRNRVTQHGLALNVATDLSRFGHIVPCGQRDRPATSLLELTGKNPGIRAVAEGMAASLARAYRREPLVWRSLSPLRAPDGSWDLDALRPDAGRG